MESDRNSESLITIGRITKPFGVRGEVSVEIATDFPRRFVEMEKILMVNPAKKEPPSYVEILSARFHKDRVLLRFQGVETVESAEKFRNCLLKITRQELMQLDADEYYVFDLIGLTVVNESGEEIGRVENVIPGGHNDLLEIRNPDTGKVNLIPCRKQFVERVDMEKGIITVTPLEGMIE